MKVLPASGSVVVKLPMTVLAATFSFTVVALNVKFVGAELGINLEMKI
ncbi:MAG: hypothetical protein ACFKPT_28705 [Gloeotrichia echinulata GP01]